MLPIFMVAIRWRKRRRSFTRILKVEGSWAQNAVVLANAAMALHATGMYAGYEEAYYAAVDSLESGRAYGALEKLISLQ